ncbi:dual specificity protein phosphatase 4 [Physeter macrocephalus]|uniref:Dual specificity protein phosphatase 4 n=1 Tax=Physeter macrocephalus TaxID=9755 RepID=A0A455AM90_PHYMC|nr:dual specificity protein phosphatase 4 [Physeter catodon]|eukprot:XP_028337760.1 dual specificity protein phosphatase 4 [Physeter catodon]
MSMEQLFMGPCDWHLFCCRDPEGPDAVLAEGSLRISGRKVSVAIMSGPTAPPSGKCRYSQPQLPNSSPPSGGYERFSSEYPEFCSKTKALATIPPAVPPSTAESLDLGCSSCGTPLHDQGGPVEILPFLYLGSAYHAARRDMLDALGITALLNVSSDCPNHFEGHYQYKCIPVEDNHKADISSWFMEAIEYIDAVKDCRGRVLVHCQAGISRSATICLAYLMMKKRVRLEEAFEFVKQRRSIISPNFSFMGQLLQFESQVLATSCAVEAASPSGPLRERGKATPTPTSQFVFSFPVSVGGHPAPSSLPYLHSPITTSPSC